MKHTLGLLLLLVGGGVMCFGGYRALAALAGLYQSNLNDALNQPEGAEKGVADAMLRGVMIAGAGVPVLLTGLVLWKIGKRRRPAP